MSLIEIKDRVFLNGDQEVVYPHCFIGSDAIKLMVSDPQFPVSNPGEAVELGSCMVSKGLVSYGVSPNGVANLPFKDDDFFYSFSPKLVAPPVPEVQLEVHTEDFKDLDFEESQFSKDKSKKTDSEDEWDGNTVNTAQLQSKVTTLEQELQAKQLLLDSTTSELATSNSQLSECRAQLRLQEELMSRRRQDALFVVSKLQEQNERLMHFAKEVQNLWRDNEEMLAQRSGTLPSLAELTQKQLSASSLSASS